MGLIMNASSQTQQVRVFGNYFTFKPGQMKMLDDKISHFIVTEKKYLGLVELDKRYVEDPEFKDSKEGKELIAKAKQVGVTNRVQHLNDVIQNEKVSLQQDLDMKGIKSSAESFMASDAYIKALEEKMDYSKKGTDEAEKKQKRIKELEDKLKAIGE